MALLLGVVLACSTQRAPKTPESMLAYRLANGGCKRTCPVGRYLDPFVTSVHQAFDRDAVLADCCIDPNGLGWSSCAWNSSGRFATREQLLAAPLNGCGGDGYPDCGAQ